MKTEKDFKDMATEFALRFAEEDFTPQEGIITMAYALSTYMLTLGYKEEDAIGDFAIILRDVFSQRYKGSQ